MFLLIFKTLILKQLIQNMAEDIVKRALSLVGNKNAYQYILISLLCVLFLFITIPILGTSLIYMDPIFKCSGSDDQVEERQACPKIQECTIINDYTIVAQLKLYCDQQGQRDLIQSSLSIGSMLGLLLMNFVSDLKGRKTALIANLGLMIIAILFTIVGTYVSSVTMLTIGALFSGFGGYSSYIISYIIAGDFCQEQLRQKGSIFMNIAYSVGLLLLCVLYNWMNEWQNILFLWMLIPFCGLFVISYILILQSPSYYLKNNQKQKCIQVLKTVGFYNGKKEQDLLPISSIINSEIISDISGQQELKPTQALIKALKNTKYLKIIILTALAQAGGNVFFFGIQFAIFDIGFNYGIDNLVIGTTEIVTALFITQFITKMKRKRTSLICYLATAALSFAFVIPGVSNSPGASTVFIVLIRILTSVAYFMIVMIQTQSFPNEIKSIGAGTIEAFSQVGSIIAPLIITIAINLNISKMASMGVVTGLLSLCLIFVPQPIRKTDDDDDQKNLQESLLES